MDHASKLEFPYQRLDTKSSIPVLILHPPVEISAELVTYLVHNNRVVVLDDDDTGTQSRILAGQGDNDEKKVRVQLMSDIYSEARNVIVWLGLDAITKRIS